MPASVAGSRGVAGQAYWKGPTMPQCNRAELQAGITLVCSSTSMLKFSFFTVRSVSFMVPTQACSI